MTPEHLARIQDLAPSLGLPEVHTEEDAEGLLAELATKAASGDEAADLLHQRLAGSYQTASATWSVGVTTAPRNNETLRRCLTSFEGTGWPKPHIFADGLSGVPEGYLSTCRIPAVGAFPNWVLALQELVQRDVAAQYYLLVQDDAIFCRNLRRYVEHFAPQGVLSLYRSARNPMGPTFKFKDGGDFCGALAMVFSQAAARKFLHDPVIYQHRLRQHRNTDAIDSVIGRWCEANDIPLEVHGPSLVQHIGTDSTLGHNEVPAGSFVGESFDAMDLLDEKVSHRTARPTKPRIGLVGFNTAQGLGYLNRDLADNLPVKSWLVVEHSRFPTLAMPEHLDTMLVPEDASATEVDAWLDGLDIVVFAETSLLAEIPVMAKAKGIRTVCIPMHEWLPRYASIYENIDLWIAPTLYSMAILAARELPGELVYHPWPIDTRRITYRQRSRAEVFAFGHGNGGPLDRKGGHIVAELARHHRFPLEVWSQTATHTSSLTDGIDWAMLPVKYRGAAADPAELYLAGDVFLAPSRWEGLGLQLLECQAAGMPLVTTDAGPMNEVNPWRTVPATPRVVNLNHPVIAYDVDPEHLAEVLRQVQHSDISEASQQARKWVVENRCWTTQAKSILSLINGGSPMQQVCQHFGSGLRAVSQKLA